jgi:hypothetical protein
MRCQLVVIVPLAAWFALGVESPVAMGDGGTLRFSGRRADRLITVFTAPAPLRSGPVDISILLQDADSGTPLSDVPIMVRAHPTHSLGEKINVPATTEAATNKLMRAARLDFTEPGTWHVQVDVQDRAQEVQIEFDVEVAEALPQWLEMWPWICLPIPVIALFGIHQVFARRRSA